VKKICAQTVGEICTREVVTCSLDTPESEVAELMVKHKVHLIPVLENGKLVGVVGRLDIVRSMGDGSGSRAEG
jgi:CBS domain-containing protein